MNTGKTHAIVVKTRTLKTRCLAMLVAMVVLGGVGVDGGWGLDLPGSKPPQRNGDQDGNSIRGPTGNCGDAVGAQDNSWDNNGDAEQGLQGPFNGARLFNNSQSDQANQANNSGGSPADSGQTQDTNSGDTAADLSSSQNNDNGSGNKCNSESDCKHKSCGSDTVSICVNGQCSCPGDDSPSGSDLPPSPSSETQSSDSELRQCPNGKCGKPPPHDPPPSPPACAGDALRCCPGQEDPTPSYCATARFKKCKCPA